MLVDEVRRFAREFINKPYTRTGERRAQIKEVLRQLTGERLGDSCNTCFIEALYTILKLTNMSKYEMKRGYVAQFNIPFKGIKSFTNNQITDELAEEYLKRYPERIVYFSRVPQPARPVVPQSIKIVKPVSKPEPAPKVNPQAAEVSSINDDLATSHPDKLIAEAMDEAAEEKPKPKPRPRKKTTAKKSE